MKYHRVRTLILWGVVTLIFLLPLGLHFFVSQGTVMLMDRSQKTPLVVGGVWGRLELVLDSLYFRKEVIKPIAYQELAVARNQNLGEVVPLHIRFFSNQFPIVGTELSYFSHRRLHLDVGRHFALLGECVVGAKVARQKGVSVGDKLISSPEEVFDLAGTYPLKMKIVGVLKQTGSVDDNAVFVDVKTAWVIEGLAHGHDDLNEEKDKINILDKKEDHITASTALREYREIDQQNMSSFHFHGDVKDYPITAILVFPRDAKSRALFLGRYLERKGTVAVYEPPQVMESLLQTVFTIESVMLVGLYLMGGAVLVIVGLVFVLSIKLRAKEFETIKRIGGSERFALGMLVLEGGVVFLSGLLSALAFVYVGGFFLDDMLHWILMHNLS